MNARGASPYCILIHPTLLLNNMTKELILVHSVCLSLNIFNIHFTFLYPVRTGCFYQHQPELWSKLDQYATYWMKFKLLAEKAYEGKMFIPFRTHTEIVPQNFIIIWHSGYVMIAMYLSQVYSLLVSVIMTSASTGGLDPIQQCYNFAKIFFPFSTNWGGFKGWISHIKQ